MSFLKQLLSPFIEFDEDKQKEVSQRVQASSNAVVGDAPSSAPPYHPLLDDEKKAIGDSQTPTYSPGGTLTEPLPEHEAYFERLIDEANLTNPLFQGNDFKEFVDSKLDIDGIADEALKYKTAFNIFKNSGLTKEKLLATGQEYLNIIGRDLNSFQSAHAQLQHKELDAKEKSLQDKAHELHALMQKANALKKEINNLTMDINLGKDKLDTVRNSFLLAGEKKQAEIQQELAKIARYF
jgi:archaellum component FlaC